MLGGRPGNPVWLALGSALALAAALAASGCSWFDTYPAPCPVDAGSAGAAGDSGVNADSSSDGGPVCGDGVVSGNEECDNGSANASGSGCETNCRFSCHSDSDCNDGNPCNGTETCQAVTGGRACKPGTPLANDAPCGSGGYCKAGVCTQPVCGNGIVEPGEDCEPPGTATCSSKCKNIVCGDGVIEGNEQCDDGNTKNLDGCDSSCRYETDMRYTTFDFSKDPAPGFCVHNGNALGDAMAAEVINTFDKNTLITINGGNFNGFLTFGGLDDLTGANAANIRLGLLTASTDPRYPAKWDPNTLDEWYVGKPSLLDSQDQPTEFFSPAAIASNVLTGGPNSLQINLVVDTGFFSLDARDAKIRASIDTSPAPDVPGPPPKALAPGLKVFQTVTATGPDQGICGVATLSSLAKVPIPEDLCLGPNSCQDSTTCAGSHKYPCSASLLDLMVGGCKSTSLCVSAALPTQPDVGTGGNPPAKLTLDSNNHVTPSVPTDGYTFLIHFAAARAHLTNNLP